MKLVFTSCMDAQRVADQPIWDHIREVEKPDALALLGDQIYMDWGDIGEPDLAAAIAAGAMSPSRFARTMHARYAAQWQVDTFRRLVCGLPDRDKPGRLIVCWDDHDFAWNNSLGQGPQEHPNAVPRQVRDISRRLFEQFVRQLRTGAPSADYPSLPADVLQPWAGDGVGESGQIGGGVFAYQLLDNRWARTERRIRRETALGTQERQGQMLEGHALEQLKTRLGQSQGLLVVLGGTPMAHDHLLSEQSWHSQAEGDYAEYRQVLEAARRPVLYLAGDVHHNVWGGRLAHPDTGKASRVVQVLSSGAALDRYKVVRFEPSYGVLELPDSPGAALAGEVVLRLWEQQDKGSWEPSLPVPRLRYGASDWTGDLEGAAAAIDDGPPDEQPLAALVCRPRFAAHRLDDPVPGTVHEGLEQVYRDGGWPRYNSWPEPVESISADRHVLKLQARCNLDQGDLRRKEMSDLLAGAFARARQRAQSGREASVVLYVHGFGKSVGSALSQAYALRRQDAAVEPVAFVWQAGEKEGLLAATGAVAMATRGAVNTAWALAQTLAAFAEQARHHPDIPAVVLARSAGALLMHHCLHTGDFDPNTRFQGVRRLVLSAPLLDHKRLLDHKGLNQALGRWKLPQFVVSNRNDRTLRWARWLFDEHDQHKIAGLFPPEQLLPENLAWLDHSDCPGTGALHDHLFVQLGEHARALRHALLCQPTVDLPALATAGHLGAVGKGVWRVH